ncbi:MAG TPA: hypothetical protein VFU66_03435 [Edaphobacter sp.]|nr:hypothetical protein [Edaphobacter sp.]
MRSLLSSVWQRWVGAVHRERRMNPMGLWARNLSPAMRQERRMR